MTVKFKLYTEVVVVGVLGSVLDVVHGEQGHFLRACEHYYSVVIIQLDKPFVSVWKTEIDGADVDVKGIREEVEGTGEAGDVVLREGQFVVCSRVYQVLGEKMQ